MLSHLLESRKGTVAPKCYCMITLSTHALFIPSRTKVIEKYLGTLNPPVVLLVQLNYSFIMEFSYVCAIIHNSYHLPLIPALV
jgi:hypothetical protein